MDRAQITFSGSRDCCFCVCENVRLPPAAIKLLECEGFDPLDDAANCHRAERNEIWITSHEADVTAVLNHGYDVTCKQRTFAPATAGRRWPMQHRAAIKMSAAVDQRHAIPKRKRGSFPKLNARTFAHDALVIGSMQKYFGIESFAPLNHRRVKMRMRNGDGANAA